MLQLKAQQAVGQLVDVLLMDYTGIVSTQVNIEEKEVDIYVSWQTGSRI